MLLKAIMQLVDDNPIMDRTNNSNLEHLFSRYIQVIGWLIQYKQSWRFYHELAKGKPCLNSTGNKLRFMM